MIGIGLAVTAHRRFGQTPGAYVACFVDFGCGHYKHIFIGLLRNLDICLLWAQFKISLIGLIGETECIVLLRVFKLFLPIAFHVATIWAQKSVVAPDHHLLEFAASAGMAAASFHPRKFKRIEQKLAERPSLIDDHVLLVDHDLEFRNVLVMALLFSFLVNQFKSVI